MQDHEILAQLKPIFFDVFGFSKELSADTQAYDVEGWDSLSHINLVITIEASFKIKFTVKEMRSLMGVGDILKVIKGKI
jgi:acyl carrier protein